MTAPNRSHGLVKLEGHDRTICPSCEHPARITDTRPPQLAVHDAGLGGECPASGWYRCLACRARRNSVEECGHCGARGWMPGVTGTFVDASGRRVRLYNDPARPGFIKVES